MALEKITEAQMNANGVVAAPDILNGTAAENKAIFDRMVRNLVAPAYNACVDVVNELMDTDAGIQENEAQRKTAEEGRAEAETERNAAEEARETSEQERTGAETARNNAETERKAAEAARTAAETERAEAEAGRKTAEQGRATAEETRAAAETAREQTFSIMRNRIEQLGVAAETLQAGAAATAEVEVDPATGGYKITLGIPKGKDGEGGGTGDMLKTTYDPRGKAQDVFKYAEDKAGEAVKAHNESDTAHSDIRAAVNGKAAASHQHGAGDITSGILTVARGGTGVASIAELAAVIGTAQAESISYSGTGKGGSSNPSSVQFSFTPDFIILANTETGAYDLVLYGVTSLVSSNNTTNSSLTFTWNQNKVTWYGGGSYGSNSGADKTQYNESGVAYKIMAFKAG